jgi:hypothetical protein
LKRVSKLPATLSSSKSTSALNTCSQCISGFIAREEWMEPAATQFMALSWLKWLKELQPENASRAITNDPKVPKKHQSIAGMPEEAIG